MKKPLLSKMKDYTKKNCMYCDDKIKKRKNESIPFYKKRKFCSLTCQHKWNTQTKTKEVKCDYCGKKLIKKISALTKHNYCSLSCSRKGRTKFSHSQVMCSYCGINFYKQNNQLFTKKHFCSRRCMGEWQSKFLIGNFAYNWRDGSTPINLKIRSLKKNIEWGLKVFKRDNFICKDCGDKKGGNLNAHHIITLSKIIKQNKIREIIDAIKCKELWDINNGITLCKKCHKKRHKKK